MYWTSSEGFTKIAGQSRKLYSRTRAVEDSPTFSLQKGSAPVAEEDAGKPHVVTGTDTTIDTVGHIWRQKLIDLAERVVAAFDSDSGLGLERADNILTTSTTSSSPQIHFGKSLLKPFRRGQIPVGVHSHRLKRSLCNERRAL
jgi:hypothetical protein